MRWMKLLERYKLNKTPTLRATNPRLGTSIIPLEKGDQRIFFRYLTDKVHALHFDGSESDLEAIIQSLIEHEGVQVQRMSYSWGRSSERLAHIHLRLSDHQEVRRVIKIQ